MMTRQLYNINRRNKSGFSEKHVFLNGKSKRADFEKKAETYFNHHPLVLWAAVLIGMPIGILLTVGLAAAIFGMAIWGLCPLGV